jgi:PncC family amidohydrolase
MEKEKKGKATFRTGLKTDRDLANAETIIYSLRGREMTLATAESMTAGAFGHALTRVAGSSLVYKGGVIVYTKELKKRLLGLPDDLLDKGLITPEITTEMARKTLEIFNVNIAVAVTGNAGPTSNDKSAGVGQVYWAIVDDTGRREISDHNIFGNRDDVRRKAIGFGLRLLRDFIEI